MYNAQEDKYKTPTDDKLSHVKKECTCCFGKDSSSVEGTRLDQNYLDIQRKQAELSEMILLPIKLGVSHLVRSHQRSLEMLCHTQHL